MGFEIVEQLGWRYPQHLVSPVAGGTLLPRIVRGLRELREVGLVDGELPRVYAAQAAGCAPVVHALEAGLEHPEPVRPEHHREVDRHRQSGGRLSGDPERQARRAAPARRSPTSRSSTRSSCWRETEGIFTEPAGGTTLAATIDLIERGVIPRDESIVVCVTGNGYKTAEVVAGTADGTGASQPGVQGVRSLARVARSARLKRTHVRSAESRGHYEGRETTAGCQSARYLAASARRELETIGSLNSIARPSRSTLTVDRRCRSCASDDEAQELRRVVDRLAVERRR